MYIYIYLHFIIQLKINISILICKFDYFIKNVIKFKINTNTFMYAKAIIV